MTVETNSVEFIRQRFASGLQTDTVVRCGEALAKKTTMGVGGVALLYAEPASTAGFITVAAKSQQ